MKSNSKDILKLMKWENSNMIYGVVNDRFYDYRKSTDILNVMYIRAERGFKNPPKTTLEMKYDKVGDKEFFRLYINDEVLSTAIIDEFDMNKFVKELQIPEKKIFIKVDNKTIVDASHIGFTTFMDTDGLSYVFSRNQNNGICTLTRSNNKRLQSGAEVIFKICDNTNFTNRWDNIKTYINQNTGYSILDIDEYYTKEELRTKYKESYLYSEGQYLFDEYGNFNDDNFMNYHCIFKSFVILNNRKFKMLIKGTNEYLRLDTVPSIDNDIEIYSITFGNDVYMISWYDNFMYKIDTILKNSKKITEDEYIDLCNLIVSAYLDKSRKCNKSLSFWGVNRELCECSKYVSEADHQEELDYQARKMGYDD